MTISASELHTRLQDLFQRMARLDQERAGVSQEIARCMGELAAVTEAEKKPAAVVVETSRRLLTFRGQLLALIESSPEMVWTTWDLANRLGVSSHSELNNIRTLLARMKKDGEIRRIGHGRYQAIV
jgi:uncharacterized membrane protein YccC